jgi:hypothetical protein
VWSSSWRDSTGAAHAQTPAGFWLAFSRSDARFSFALGDADGVIRRGEIDLDN